MKMFFWTSTMVVDLDNKPPHVHYKSDDDDDMDGDNEGSVGAGCCFKRGRFIKTELDQYSRFSEHVTEEAKALAEVHGRATEQVFNKSGLRVMNSRKANRLNTAKHWFGLCGGNLDFEGKSLEQWTQAMTEMYHQKFDDLNKAEWDALTATMEAEID
ncbi:hypothetical protein FPV67DRAFT_1673733 [Lyophyllum atratum]|nr:hypothetical protein FPV67DRAFT_1673733 [Lyophyllum atratum]